MKTDDLCQHAVICDVTTRRPGSRAWRLVLTVTAVLTVLASVADGLPPLRRCVCYYVWKKNGLLVDNVDAHLCTHVILGFATVANSTVSLVDMEGIESVRKFSSSMRSRNPRIKLLISVGGGAGDSGFSNMLSTPANINTFIRSVLQVMLVGNLDGVDLDYEFPKITERSKVNRLLCELRRTFNSDDEILARHFLLTIAVPGQKTLAAVSYIIPEMAACVDFVNIMTYDLVLYHNWYPFVTYHNALYPSRRQESLALHIFNVEQSILYWIQQGVPRDKVVMGIPTYAVTWQLLDPKRHDLGALSTGVGKLGSNINYSDVCNLNATHVLDIDSRVPFAYTPDGVWISYDNEWSVTEKVKWALAQNLSGVMIFALHADDHKGSSCSKRTFPLHRTIKETLNANSPSTDYF